MEISNFRGYKSKTKIEFNDLTAFVGKNDAGKSTILEALDIFFHDGKGDIKLDKKDINVYCSQEGNNDIEFTVCFENVPASVIIDSSFETSLSDEHLLLSDGTLCIMKRFANAGACKTYIKAHHPTNPNCSDLLLKKNSELKAIIKRDGIECENQTINSLTRRVIWGKYANDLRLEDTEIDITKEDAKKIWEKLEPYLPVYALFQADRKNSDGDDEIQDPLKEAVKIILLNPEIKIKLDEISVAVQSQLSDVASRTLNKIQEMDPSIANSLNPVIPSSDSLKWTDVFKSVSISGDDNIPINKRGSGVKRLILLNFFRAEAEKRISEGNGIIYAIEEPETSQHNSNQKILVEALKSLSSANDSQVILTTHSSFLVKNLQFDNIRIVTTDENEEKSIIRIIEPILHYPSLNEVNYIAFGDITEEYHNELWSYIEFQQWKDRYNSGKPTRTYIRLLKDGSTRQEQKTLSEYIRHLIHHPENTNNIRYTRDELRQSIEMMRAFIKNELETTGAWDPEV